MRTISCEPLGRSVSALGFGCASLGSRVSPHDGLQALHLAFEQGVTWYDVAPPYGDGQAEALLGQFLQGRRDQVAICTKVGIDRLEISRAKRLIRSLARPVVKSFPQLRQSIVRVRKPTTRAPITAQMIEPSVIRSLRDLKTEYIDVLALHEPTPAEVADPSIIEALRAVVTKGYVLALSIAGGADSIAASDSEVFSFAQRPDNPFGEGAAGSGSDTVRFLVTHSIFGSGALDKFSARLARCPDYRDRLKAIGYNQGARPNEILLDYAFANNANGVVLTSMYTPDHITFNIRQASSEPDRRLTAAVRAIVEFAPSRLVQ